jgi:hypothetical protein
METIEKYNVFILLGDFNYLYGEVNFVTDVVYDPMMDISLVLIDTSSDRFKQLLVKNNITKKVIKDFKLKDVYNIDHSEVYMKVLELFLTLSNVDKTMDFFLDNYDRLNELERCIMRWKNGDVIVGKRRIIRVNDLGEFIRVTEDNLYHMWVRDYNDPDDIIVEFMSDLSDAELFEGRLSGVVASEVPEWVYY